MKNLGIVLAICILLYSCKKDKDAANIDTEITPQDSLVIEAPRDVEAFTIDPLPMQNSSGITQFLYQNKPIISFDTRSHEGVIKINGEVIKLSNLDFSETSYVLKGSNISIEADNGNFDEVVDNCLNGVFSDIKITYKNRSQIVKNVRVKDCQAY